jgi:hypothetical protein
LGHALRTIVHKPKKDVYNSAIPHLMIKGQKHKSLIYVAYVGEKHKAHELKINNKNQNWKR